MHHHVAPTVCLVLSHIVLLVGPFGFLFLTGLSSCVVALQLLGKGFGDERVVLRLRLGAALAVREL